MPDVMNSQKWQDLLQTIQKDLSRIHDEDQPLAVIVKHLSSAKQRFESSADPIAKVAFLLLPLAMSQYWHPPLNFFKLHPFFHGGPPSFHIDIPWRLLRLQSGALHHRYAYAFRFQ